MRKLQTIEFGSRERQKYSLAGAFYCMVNYKVFKRCMMTAIGWSLYIWVNSITGLSISTVTHNQCISKNTTISTLYLLIRILNLTYTWPLASDMTIIIFSYVFSFYIRFLPPSWNVWLDYLICARSAHFIMSSHIFWGCTRIGYIHFQIVFVWNKEKFIWYNNLYYCASVVVCVGWMFWSHRLYIGVYMHTYIYVSFIQKKRIWVSHYHII